MERLASRRRSLGHTVRAYGRQELLLSAAPTLESFLRSRTGTLLVPCPFSSQEERKCVILRGARPMNLRVFVDDVFLPGGAEWLASFGPEDIYHVEVYPSLGMVRLYTPSFIEMLARSGRSLPPICIVC